MDVLDAYREVGAKNGLPPMKPGAYTADVMSIAAPDALWKELDASGPIQGWLQFQSKQLPFRDGLPEPRAQWGLLLAAEAVTADGVSLLIGQDGLGGWRFTRYRHGLEGDLVCDEVTQLAHDPKTGRLCYRRYWKHTSDQGYVPDCACFIGFK